MKERSFDEMVAYVNRRVSEMDIAQVYKMELLGMVTALGYKHEQTAQRWIPCSERLPEKDQICIVTDDTRRCAYEYGFHNETYDEVNGWTYLGHNVVAWMPLPEPWR